MTVTAFLNISPAELRVGEFKYYNMSEAVESALRAFNDIAK